MIALRDATVTAGGFALRVDLDVPNGAFCAVIGPSGGGKSTLLLGLAGFLPIAGTAEIDGRPVAALPPAERPVTLLFQENNLFPALSLEQNVGLGLRPSLSLSRAERARVAEALARVGLEGLGPRRPDMLSGGQRQRAALARALLRERPVLLLDEPFAALGPGQRAEMLALTRDTARRAGATTLMVTHAPQEARAADFAAFCEAVGPDAGRIDGARPAHDLFADPPPALAAYLGVASSG
ncbi:ATP-binding cassette domain-containing protein [Rubrimonas cliftonensis]|uniref:Thiamine transport system ATP-binding protein n=1 Tax=Rubrimonas cliftonensis TaxID=89524 RepID=A0A1H4C140_9RHOB|nr:ATP-binding cassette domain-containing protein [Rubrimonas cliftonensis]SEA54037.1 thiamine transport system ATP-binding protein [Rubrimonas cliftonensis]